MFEMALGQTDAARMAANDLHGEGASWTPFADPSNAQYGILPTESVPFASPPGLARGSEEPPAPTQGTAADLRQRLGHSVEAPPNANPGSEEDILDTLSRQPMPQRMLALEECL